MTPFYFEERKKRNAFKHQRNDNNKHMFSFCTVNYDTLSQMSVVMYYDLNESTKEKGEEEEEKQLNSYTLYLFELMACVSVCVT